MPRSGHCELCMEKGHVTVQPFCSPVTKQPRELLENLSVWEGNIKLNITPSSKKTSSKTLVSQLHACGHFNCTVGPLFMFVKGEWAKLKLCLFHPVYCHPPFTNAYAFVLLPTGFKR